jgi:hypothetical protein
MKRNMEAGGAQSPTTSSVLSEIYGRVDNAKKLVLFANLHRDVYNAKHSE